MVKLNNGMRSCVGASQLVVKDSWETAASQSREVGRKLPFECNGGRELAE